MIRAPRADPLRRRPLGIAARSSSIKPSAISRSMMTMFVVGSRRPVPISSETSHEKGDVDGHFSWRMTCLPHSRRLSHGGCPDQRANASRGAIRVAAGIIELDVAAKAGDLLDHADETKPCSRAVMRRRYPCRGRAGGCCGPLHLHLEVADGPQPSNDEGRAPSVQKSTVSPSNASTVTREASGPASASAARSVSIRASSDSSEDFFVLRRTATISWSNAPEARRMTSRCPL